MNQRPSLPELRLPLGLPAQLAQALALLWEILSRLLRGEALFAEPSTQASTPRHASEAPQPTTHATRREDWLTRFLRGGKLRRRAQRRTVERDAESESRARPAARPVRAWHGAPNPGLPAAQPRAIPKSAARAPPDVENHA